MRIRFRGGNVLCPDGQIRKTDLLIGDGVILSLGDAEPEAEQTVDCAGRYLFPGLVDVHTHGRIGYDFTSATAEQMKQMRDDYARRGVTSLFPTLASATPVQWHGAIAAVQEVGFEGIHLEGRWLNPAKRGAHAVELLSPPDAADLASYLSEIHIPCHVTYAPELDADGSFAATALSHGATLGLGHSAATAAEARLAIARGVTSFTHLCNAMPPIHHREGGAVCEALTSDCYAELIADGLHVCPDMVKLIYRCKGAERLVLITDSMEATGAPDGTYSIAGQPAIVKNGRAQTPDGALAGSLLNLWDGVKNLVSFAGAAPGDAILCATRNPARMVGIDATVGTLEPGKRADLLLSDASLSLCAVYRCGEPVF